MYMLNVYWTFVKLIKVIGTYQRLQILAITLSVAAIVAFTVAHDEGKADVWARRAKMDFREIQNALSPLTRSPSATLEDSASRD